MCYAHRASQGIKLPAMQTDEYTELAALWQVSLKAANKSRETTRSYMTGVNTFARWCADQGIDPDLTVGNAEAFIAALLDAGQTASTAISRLLPLRLFSAWLVERDYADADGLARVKAPKLDRRVVDALTETQVDALLDTCKGKRFIDVRDRALVRFMAATGARAEEVISMKTYDLQIAVGSCVIVRGKGGKGRRSGFGPKVADALGAYKMARRKHPLAARDELWLAERRRVLNYDALYVTLRRRAEKAGIHGFHPHMLRHTAAVRWLRAGGSVTGLMSECGWTDVSMVQRYIETSSAELAIEESHRLNL